METPEGWTQERQDEYDRDYERDGDGWRREWEEGVTITTRWEQKWEEDEEKDQ